MIRKILKPICAISAIIAISFSLSTAALFQTAHAAGLTLVVNSTADDADANPGDNVCDIGDGSCTLRAAIQEANADSALDTIQFAITGTADFTVDSQDGYRITPATTLPQVTTSVAIEGLSQSGAECDTSRTILIEIDGTTSPAINGIISFGAGSDSSTLEGIALINSQGYSLQVNQSDGTLIQCNNVGIRADSVTDAASVGGMQLLDSDAVEIRNNIVGNINSNGIIATYLTNAIFDSNYIGTNLDSDDKGNSSNGINITGGSSATVTNNVVGFNSGIGIIIDDVQDSEVHSNYSGINEDLDTDIGNAGDGIAVRNTTGVNVGDIDTPNYVFANASGAPSFGGITTFESSDISIRGNRVSGNDNVQIIFSFNTSESTATANRIGSTANSDIPLAISDSEGIGIFIASANDNMIGGTNTSDANVIAGVSGTGIGIVDLEVTAIPTTAAALGNTVIGNSIYDIESVVLTQYGATDPFDMGIDLFHAIDSSGPPDFIPDSFEDAGPTPNDDGDVDDGANNYLNFPIINSAVQLDDQLDLEFDLTADGSPSGEYRVEFYASEVATSSGFGPGQTFLGSVNTTAGSNQEATLTLGAGIDIEGQTISVTATSIDEDAPFGFGGTSEFGNQVVGVLGTSVVNTTTTVPGNSDGSSAQDTLGTSGTLPATGNDGLSLFSISIALIVIGLLAIRLPNIVSRLKKVRIF